MIKDPILFGYSSFLGLIIAYLPTCPSKNLAPVALLSLFLVPLCLLCPSISHFMHSSPAPLSPPAFPSCSSCSIAPAWSLNGVPNTPTLLHPPLGLSAAIGPNISPGEGMSPTLSYPPGNSTISDLSPSIQAARSISPSDPPSSRPESAGSPFPATGPIRSPSSFPYLFPGLPSLPFPSFHLCPSSLLHPRCLTPRFATPMPSAHRGLPHRPTHLRMVAPCLRLSRRPRPLRRHARPPRSTAPIPRQPMTPALEPSNEIVLPGCLPGSPITDPSLPTSFSFPSLSLPIGQPLRDSGLLSRSVHPAPRDLQPLLGPFPPSSWSNAAFLSANVPGSADVANRLSSPPLDLMSAPRACDAVLRLRGGSPTLRPPGTKSLSPASIDPRSMVSVPPRPSVALAAVVSPSPQPPISSTLIFSAESSPLAQTVDIAPPSLLNFSLSSLSPNTTAAHLLLAGTPALLSLAPVDPSASVPPAPDPAAAAPPRGRGGIRSRRNRHATDSAPPSFLLSLSLFAPGPLPASLPADFEAFNSMMHDEFGYLGGPGAVPKRAVHRTDAPGSHLFSFLSPRGRSMADLDLDKPPGAICRGRGCHLLVRRLALRVAPRSRLRTAQQQWPNTIIQHPCPAHQTSRDICSHSYPKSPRRLSGRTPSIPIH